jgi:alpha-tubulin suppressor-like RCC1 family protein
MLAVDSVHTPTLMPALADRRVCAVAPGFSHVLILADGAVFTYGVSQVGVLGHGPETFGPINLWSNREHNVETPKEVTTWLDRKGEPMATPYVVEIAAGNTSSFAFSAKGDGFAWGQCCKVSSEFDSAEEMGDSEDGDDCLPDSTLGLGSLELDLYYPQLFDLPKLKQLR